MTNSNFFQSLSKTIEQSQIDRDATITDRDIENLRSEEIPELNEFLNARITLTKTKRNLNPRPKKRGKKNNE